MNLTIIILIAIIAFILLILGGLAIVNYSGEEMVEKFNQASKIETNMSAVDFANIIIQKYFNNKISINFNNNMLSDCYSSNNVLTLCNKYAYENNLAGLSICAHELGHAFQFKNQDTKMKKYGKKHKLSLFLSKLITPLILTAIVLLLFDKLVFAIIFAGLAIVFFVVALSVKMSTIKIEKEASEIAIKLLQDVAQLPVSKLNTAKKILDSAKLTYVADLLKSMLKWTALTRK